jgi:hypothetical protein
MLNVFHLDIAKVDMVLQNIDLVPTCMHFHGCTKRGSQQHVGAWAWVVPTYMHGCTTWNEAKCAAVGTGLCVYVQDHVGRADRHTVVATYERSEAGGSRCSMRSNS